jgi:superfamily II helicase
MFKVCSRCERNKKVEHFHKLKKGLFGYNSICKICRSQHRIENINNKKDMRRHINTIICNDCNIEKNKNNFYKNNSSKTGYQIYCKVCQKKKISESKSKLENYVKIILDRFIKKNKNLEVTITEHDIINKYYEQNKKCIITNHVMDHSVDTRQRTDNIWNLSIYVDDNIYTVNKDNFNLVVHLIYTIKHLYNLDRQEILEAYNNMTELANYEKNNLC